LWRAEGKTVVTLYIRDSEVCSLCRKSVTLGVEKSREIYSKK